MRRYVIGLALLLCVLPLGAQTDRREVRRGNREFRKGAFREAEIDYRKALVKDSLSLAGEYNLASTLYRLEDYENAGKALETVKEVAPASAYASDYHYNAGDVALARKDYAAAVDAFKASLLLNPGDLDAKENYIYAKKMLENQQNGGGGGSDNQDQQNQDQDGQQPQPQPNISRQQAQQMLRAIQAREKETQDKVNREKAAALQSRQKEKNW